MTVSKLVTGATKLKTRIKKYCDETRDGEYAMLLIYESNGDQWRWWWLCVWLMMVDQRKKSNSWATSLDKPQAIKWSIMVPWSISERGGIVESSSWAFKNKTVWPAISFIPLSSSKCVYQHIKQQISFFLVLEELVQATFLFSFFFHEVFSWKRLNFEER